MRIPNVAGAQILIPPTGANELHPRPGHDRPGEIFKAPPPTALQGPERHDPSVLHADRIVLALSWGPNAFAMLPPSRLGPTITQTS